MSNAFDKASLVMLPHAYEEGKLYSLKPTDRSGDFTFSRGTDTATRVNEQGYIEKEIVNLLEQSNNFSDSSWLKATITPSGGEVGYDGSNDAWRLTADSTSSSARIENSVSSNICTYSVYAKEGNTSSIGLRSNDSTTITWFDLSGNGSFTQGSNAIDASMVSIGNGWFRISVVFSSVTSVRFYVSDNAGGYSVTGGKYLYIQDAMLNPGLVAQPYLETTTAPVYGGLTDNMPRLDYSGGASCPSLLLEPSRTNLVSGSEYLEQFWGGNSTRVYNQITSPEGVENGTKIYPSSTGSFRGVNKTFGSSLSNTPYTLSVFAKASEFEYLTFYNIGSPDGNNGVWFNLTSGSVETTQPAWTSAKMENFGNGWYRCSAVITPGGSADYLYILLTDSNGSIIATANGTDGLYIYGTQLEQGSYPTSYIPTYGSTQTRAEDFFDSSADFTNFFGDNQGTIYIETDKRLFEGLSTNEEFIGLRDDTKNWRIIGSQSIIFIQCTNWGSSIQHYPSNTNPTKYLFKWDGSNVSFYIDGILIGTATQTAPFNPYQFGRTGNGVSMDSKELLNQFTLFPTALSDAECIALTQN